MAPCIVNRNHKIVPAAEKATVPTVRNTGRCGWLVMRRLFPASCALNPRWLIPAVPSVIPGRDAFR